MPAKKQPRKSAGPAWHVILAEMRSQNRATIEEVQATRTALERRMDRLGQESRERDVLLEAAVRQNSADIRELKGEVKVLQGDVKVLQDDVKALQGEMKELQGDVRGLQGVVQGRASKDETSRLDARVTAIEQRLA